MKANGRQWEVAVVSRVALEHTASQAIQRLAEKYNSMYVKQSVGICLELTSIIDLSRVVGVSLAMESRRALSAERLPNMGAHN